MTFIFFNPLFSQSSLNYDNIRIKVKTPSSDTYSEVEIGKHQDIYLLKHINDMDSSIQQISLFFINQKYKSVVDWRRFRFNSQEEVESVYQSGIKLISSDEPQKVRYFDFGAGVTLGLKKDDNSGIVLFYFEEIETPCYLRVKRDAAERWVVECDEEIETSYSVRMELEDWKALFGRLD